MSDSLQAKDGNAGETTPVVGIAMVCEKRHDRGEPDIFYPAVFCTVCGERITDVKEGNAYWRPSFAEGSDAFYAARWPIVFAHKRCDRAPELRSAYWQPLEAFIAFLGRNLGMDVPSDVADR